MKRFSWFTDGVRDAENGKWVLYEEHLAIVDRLKERIEELEGDIIEMKDQFFYGD